MNELQAQTNAILEAAGQLHNDLHALYWQAWGSIGILFLILIMVAITRRQ